MNVAKISRFDFSSLHTNLSYGKLLKVISDWLLFLDTLKQEYKSVDNNGAIYTNQDKNCLITLKTSIQHLLGYCFFKVSNKSFQDLIGAPAELIA